jgi:hypothetical protein
MHHRAQAPRVTVIEGRRVLVIDRRPPLPQRLDALLATPGMRRFPVRVSGWRSACGEQDHRLVPFAEGRYRGPDLERRTLRLLICADCESVCVRDVTVDRLVDQAGIGPRRTPTLAPRRRDLILGWYTGARRNQRQYT